jgi:hypothetical protein
VRLPSSESEANFSQFITPFTGALTEAQLDELLDAVIGNNQNYAAAASSGLLATVLRNAGVNRVPRLRRAVASISTFAGVASLSSSTPYSDCLQRMDGSRRRRSRKMTTSSKASNL